MTLQKLLNFYAGEHVRKLNVEVQRWSVSHYRYEMIPRSYFTQNFVQGSCCVGRERGTEVVFLLPQHSEANIVFDKSDTLKAFSDTFFFLCGEGRRGSKKTLHLYSAVEPVLCILEESRGMRTTGRLHCVEVLRTFCVLLKTSRADKALSSHVCQKH